MTTAALLGGFGVLAVAAVALELSARLRRGRLATLDDLADYVTRRRGPRLALLAGWLWLGWHLFVR